MLRYLLGNVDISVAKRASEIARVDTTEATSMLVSLLENAYASNGKITAAVAFNLREECLRAQVTTGVIDHCVCSSFHI